MKKTLKGLRSLRELFHECGMDGQELVGMEEEDALAHGQPDTLFADQNVVEEHITLNHSTDVSHLKEHISSLVVTREMSLIVEGIKRGIRSTHTKLKGAACKVAVMAVSCQRIVSDASSVVTFHILLGRPPQRSVARLADRVDALATQPFGQTQMGIGELIHILGLQAEGRQR